ncbi:MAG: helix-turn-helix transcriptional regulator [Enterobacteriaceae bacterium]
MSRSERLLALLQLLRTYRFPVTGARLAEELNISLRTLYRDIATLQAQGATIEGEAGIGYLLRPGFMLPPLMFSEEELEALVLGSRWVAKRADSRLSAGAQNALSKIAAVLPAELRLDLETNALLIGPPTHNMADQAILVELRQAIRQECKIKIEYQDLQQQISQRTLWPFAIGYFDHLRLLVAWCELRQDFRNFRTERITRLTLTQQRYPRRRQSLLQEWRKTLHPMAPPEPLLTEIASSAS